MVEDSCIIQLFWDRDQQAIAVTADKYGGYCRAVAQNILGNSEDAEECVNDTWLGAWNAMPPHRPHVLSVFLGRITRNLSFNKYKHDRAAKRGGGEIGLVLDELAECVSGKEDVGEELDRRELIRAINVFLDTLPQVKRELFVGRYWYTDKISSLARRCRMSENHVSVTLGRVRGQLKAYLLERGFEL